MISRSEILPVGVPLGRKVRARGVTLQVVLHDPGQDLIELMFKIEFVWDTGEVKRWSFDGLKEYCMVEGCPELYDKVLQEAIAVDRRLFAGGSA